MRTCEGEGDITAKSTTTKTWLKIKIILLVISMFFILYVIYDKIDPYEYVNETITGTVRDVSCALQAKYGYPVCNVVIVLENKVVLNELLHYKPGYKNGDAITFKMKKRKLSGIVGYYQY